MVLIFNQNGSLVGAKKKNISNSEENPFQINEESSTSITTTPKPEIQREIIIQVKRFIDFFLVKMPYYRFIDFQLHYAQIDARSLPSCHNESFKLLYQVSLVD